MNATANDIMTSLEANTQSLTIHQLISELQVAVERISFVDTAAGGIKNKMGRDEVDLLYEDELSDQMMGFIYWTSDKGWLNVLRGETGRIFLSHCIRTYKKIRQISFQTCVQLDDATQIQFSKKLAVLYPAGARIIFEVEPRLNAGFRIDDGQKVIDRSLRSIGGKLVLSKVEESYNG